MKTQALVYLNPWKINLNKIDFCSQLNDFDVLVEIKATGICGTDIGIITGKYNAKQGVVLGHESSGQVLKVGSKVGGIKRGDRVYIDPTYYCGRCEMCFTGRPNHCQHKNITETGVSRDGTFCRYYVTEERFLCKIPDNVSFEAATFAEPLSCVLTGLNQLRELKIESRILIFGAGPIGMLYALTLGLKGLSGGIIEKSCKRLRLGKGLLRKEWSIFSDHIQAMKKLSYTGVDLIIDTTGYLLKESLQLLSRGGQILLVGLKKSNVEINPMVLTDRSQSIIGSVDSIYTFSTACHIINKKMIEVEKLISHQFCLKDYAKALKVLGICLNTQEMVDSQGLKVIINFNYDSIKF